MPARISATFTSFQVQVKSNSDSNTSTHDDINFHLLLRDALGQIDSLTENRKFVAKEGSKRDYRFNISIPKTDTYFPLLKYKCMGDLRPVPIVRQIAVPAAWHASIICSSHPVAARPNQSENRWRPLPRRSPNQFES